MIDIVDRRKHPRFQVDYSTVAALTGSKVGKIRDISRGGLAFSYLGNKYEDDVAASESPEVSIIHDPDFSLRYVPCNVIEDEYCPPDHHGLMNLPAASYGVSNSLFGTFTRGTPRVVEPKVRLKVRMCRIQFYPLTPDQEAQLDYFISNFVIGFSWEAL
jgi:hypothetical protein